MTRKHYNAIAESLKYCKPCKIAQPKGYKARLEQWKGTVEELTSTVGQFNSNFDRQRFLSACNYEV